MTTIVHTTYSETNFPERLFVIGAGPSLELLYPYREEMNEWGEWVVQRPDLVQPFLEYINPLYTISYDSQLARVLAKHKEYYEPLRGISLDTPLGNTRSGGSIGGFISQFEKFGGKELFLFGYDGTSSGYWRNQPPLNPEDLKQIGIDTDVMNASLSVSARLYHLGKTKYTFMTEISVEGLKKLIK
tara:strand:+ start:1031 stop:1588 length:558 start_codon:yes stop_codon:yes gene_type:complete